MSGELTHHMNRNVIQLQKSLLESEDYDDHQTKKQKNISYLDN